MPKTAVTVFEGELKLDATTYPAQLYDEDAPLLRIMGWDWGPAGVEPLRTLAREIAGIPDCEDVVRPKLAGTAINPERTKIVTANEVNTKQDSRSRRILEKYDLNILRLLIIDRSLHEMGIVMLPTPGSTTDYYLSVFQHSTVSIPVSMESNEQSLR